MTEYINLKKTAEIISVKVGCCKRTVLLYLDKHNIKKRNNIGANTGKVFSKQWKENMGESRKGKLLGNKNPNFKGGRIKDIKGYVLVLCNDHPNKNINNRVFEHRLIVESQIGRYLTKEEQVHHINGIKDDNRIENLMCFKNQSAHQRFHKNAKNVKELEIIFDGRKLK